MNLKSKKRNPFTFLKLSSGGWRAEGGGNLNNKFRKVTAQKKRKILLEFIMLIFIFSIIILLANKTKFKFTGFVIDEGAQVSMDVIKTISENGTARVIIELTENASEYLAPDTPSENNLSFLEPKIKQDYGEIITAQITKQDLRKLAEKDCVQSIDIVPSRSILLDQSVPQINATSVWQKTLNRINLTGTGETACVIDTGIDYTHPDLGGCYGNNNLSSTCRVIGGWDYCADDSSCTTEDSDPKGVHSHGTHCAGIIGANGVKKGVAPNVRFVALKVCNSGGSCWDDDIKAAIDWCIQNKEQFNISVISMSLGGGLYTNNCDNIDDPLNITGSINTAFANNLSVVVAAGNDGNTSDISWPACITNSIPVSSIRKDDTTIDFNRNKLVMLLAPGVSITSTITGSSYATMSGTSMATPHVAGAIILLNQYQRAFNKSLTPLQYELALNITGKRTPDYGSKLNYSRIDIYSALLYIDNEPPTGNLISPPDLQYNLQNINFQCNATDIQLQNLSLIIYNASGEILKTNITAQTNIAQSNLTTTLNKGVYWWNCIAADKKNNHDFLSQSNRTIGKLLLTINSPQNNSQNNGNFSITLNTESACNFTITDATNSTQMQSTDNKTFSASIQNLTNGTLYNIQFYCISNSDENITNSSYFYFIGPAQNTTQNNTNNTIQSNATQAPEQAGNSGSNSGISSAINTQIQITPPQLAAGVSKQVFSGNTLLFQLASESHKLKIEEINSNTSSIQILITSNPIRFKLKTGETKKLDLNQDNILDLEIQLISIKNNSANLSLKNISQAIPVRQIFSNASNQTTPIKEENSLPTPPKKEPEKNQNTQALLNKINLAISISIIILALVIVIIMIRKKYLHPQKPKIIRRKKRLCLPF